MILQLSVPSVTNFLAKELFRGFRQWSIRSWNGVIDGLDRESSAGRSFVDGLSAFFWQGKLVYSSKASVTTTAVHSFASPKNTILFHSGYSKSLSKSISNFWNLLSQEPQRYSLQSHYEASKIHFCGETKKNLLTFRRNRLMYEISEPFVFFVFSQETPNKYEKEWYWIYNFSCFHADLKIKIKFSAIWRVYELARPLFIWLLVSSQLFPFPVILAQSHLAFATSTWRLMISWNMRISKMKLESFIGMSNLTDFWER
jgi:hypothetical protein